MSLVYIPAYLAESRMYREAKTKEWQIHNEPRNKPNVPSVPKVKFHPIGEHSATTIRCQYDMDER